MAQEVFLLAGETSGDARGAELIHALRSRTPSLTFAGMGGPRMREAGMEILADVSDLAVVGIVEVLRHYRTFKHTMDLLLEEIRRRKPSMVIGVDYPGFNLRLLKRVRQAMPNEPVRLVNYVSPQLWAWNENRKWQMATYLDLVLCIFPFEPKVYEGTGLKAIFIGHPLASTQPTPLEARDPHLVAFFPGSREKELRAHIPILVEAERLLTAARPKLRCAYAASSESSRRIIQSFSPKAVFAPAQELQHQASSGAICSGTATLEAALAGLPMCVFYRVAWPTYWMGRALIKVPYLAMPNLLANRPLIKELIQSNFTPKAVALEIERLCQSPSPLQGYQEIRMMLDKGPAPENAAKEILNLI